MCDSIHSKKTKPVKVLGNGPSLNTLFESGFDHTKYCYCCVNWSPQTDVFFNIKPEYYVTVDSTFFSDIFVANTDFRNRILSIDWEMFWVVPQSSYSFVKKMLRKKQNIHLIKHPDGIYLQMKLQRLRNRLFKYKIASPPAQNVVIAAIYNLVMEGFNTIELYGVEHSWLQQIAINEQNEVCLKDYHYYDDVNAEVLLKPWRKIGGGVFTMHELLRTLADTFEGYHDLVTFANHIGDIKIINYTKGSFIDAFERR